jgi:hypothetical protein
MSATSSSVGQTEDLRIRLLTLHRNLEARIGAAPRSTALREGYPWRRPVPSRGSADAWALATF